MKSIQRLFERMMNLLIKPVKFIVPLPEVEVRMTLRELCGSGLEGYPFRGDVEQHSFALRKNSRTRGAPQPKLVGDLIEQNGQTHVQVKCGIGELIEMMLILLAFFIAAAYFLALAFEKDLAFGIAIFITTMGFGIFFLVVKYLMILSSFRRSVAKIKKYLTESNTRIL